MQRDIRSPVAASPDRRFQSLSSRFARQWVVHVPDTHMDTVLREAVSPLARDPGDGTHVELMYFQRHVKPEWSLRIHVAGEGRGFGPAMEARAERLLAPLRERGTVGSWRWTEAEAVMDDPAVPGVETDVERLFHHDTAACLAWLDCAAAGATRRSRREFSLLMTERILDLLTFDRDDRLEFYRMGCRRPFEQGTWTDEDRSTLDERYSRLRDSLRAFVAAGPPDEHDAWGGYEPATIASRCLAASRPHLDGIRGARAGDLVPLTHALCQRHCNRLGIDGLAEAVLRYLMLRFHEDGAAELG